MKKIVFFVCAMLASLASQAQGNNIPDYEGLIRAGAILLLVYLLSSFILKLIKLWLDYRVKFKILEKGGVSDDLARHLLQHDTREVRTHAAKWFIIFLGIGVGLLGVSLVMPFGIHSLAILSISIALSYLGYYYFVKQSAKQ